MPNDLIYDVGVNNGSDSAYYLHKGFRVVGIEASPVLVENLRRRFAREIADGRYTLLNIGVGETAGKFDFWVCDDRSEWSSFHREIASRNGARHHAVSVSTAPFADILQEHGSPYYCKIDIEGNDSLCLQGMTPQTKPIFISIEMSHKDGGRDLQMLKGLGYRDYKLVSQVSRAQPALSLLRFNAALPYRARRVMLGIEKRLKGVPRDGEWRFETGSSGPFGEATPGSWRSFDYVHGVWERLRDLTAGGSTLGDWYDIHAR